MDGRSEFSEGLGDLADRLSSFAEDAESLEPADLDIAIADLFGIRNELFGLRTRTRTPGGARKKILMYLQAHVGEKIAGEQLAAVSGIQEWARRVRELRVEHGWDIVELGGSQYMLRSLDRDESSAENWRMANEIRRRRGGARARIEEFLVGRVGEVVTREQIDYVANIKEGVRRLREIRDEGGWPIQSFIDDPDLAPGEYRLLSADPADRSDGSQRHYSEDLRRQVFERDDYRCQVCQRNREMAIAAGDSRFYLEVHHRIAVADELAQLPKAELNKLDNLVTVCHADHKKETAKLHAAKRERRPGG
jgi:hypothetical protein